MAEEKKKPLFSVERSADGALLLRGRLQHGLSLGGELLQDFEMAESSMADIFKAEEIAPASSVITFSAALMSLQLRRLGSMDGPFTLGVIGKLKKVDFNILRAAQLELEREGEAEQHGE